MLYRMVVAVDVLTRSLAIVGAVSGLIGTSIGLAAYLRDRPQLIVRSGRGGKVLRLTDTPTSPPAKVRLPDDWNAPEERPSGRVFVSNHGRQPITIVEAGLTTLPRISPARKVSAWGLFLLLFPIWILVGLTVKALEPAVRGVQHHRYMRVLRRRRSDEPIPPFKKWESRLPTKLDMRVRFLVRSGRVWLSPDLDTEPLLLAPGQAKILVLPWPQRNRPEPLFAFATDSRGRIFVDSQRASRLR
jgi:hypothetical protein